MEELIVELLSQLLPASLLAVVVVLYERVKRLEARIERLESKMDRVERLTTFMCSKLNGGEKCLV